MANYQSIPRRFNRPTSSINHAAIDRTLREKQNTIDATYGFLQQQVDQTLGQDLIREQDREYLKEKVSGVLDTLSKTDQIRFDSNKARFTIQNALSDAARDPEILRQIANTQRVRQVQQFYQDRQKKGDINQQNFNYAYKKSGIDSYLNGDQDVVGDFQYLDYVDVDAKLDEAARKLKAANPNETVSIQNPMTGQIISKKVSMITPEEMRNHLRVQLNANDLKQLEIDGAMLYGMDDQAAVSYRDSLIANNNKKYADRISYLENLRDNGNKTEGEKAQISQQIQDLTAEKSYLERSLIGQKTAEAIGGQQLIDNKVNLYSNLYTKNGPESVKYDSDYIKRMRDANANANLASQVGGTNPNISTITTPTQLPDSVDPYQEGLNTMDRTLQDNSNYLTSQFNSLDENKKQLVSATMEEVKNDPEVLALYKGQPLSNEALQLETINRLGPNFFPPDVAQQLRSRIGQTRAINDSFEKTTTEFVRAQTLQEDVFEQLQEESRLTMVTPQGEVNIQDFLRSNGVTNYDTYKSFVNGDSKASKQLRATLSLQSMSLTNDVSTDDALVLPAVGSPVGGVFVSSGVGDTNRIDLDEGQYRMMRQSAHDLTGESLEETYYVQKSGDGYTLNLKNPESNFARIVNQTNALFQSGRSSRLGNFGREIIGIDVDRTARNESVIRSKFDNDAYREFASNNLRFLDKTVAGSNSIRIQGDEKKNVDPIYNEILQYTDNPAFNKKLPIDIYKREDGSLFISQTLKDKTVNKDGEVAQQAEFVTATVQANDVPKMQNFNQQINLMQTQSSLRSLEDVAGSINKMNFIGNNREQVEGLNRLYDRNNPAENTFRKLSGSQTAREMIFSSSVNQYMPADHPIRQQFQDFVVNTQNYKLDFTKGIDSDYQVLIKDQDGNDVGAIPLNDNVPVDTFEKAFQGTPQVFLAMYSKMRVDKYMNSLLQNGSR